MSARKMAAPAVRVTNRPIGRLTANDKVVIWEGAVDPLEPCRKRAVVKAMLNQGKRYFRRAELSGANLSWLELRGCDFSQATLVGANLVEADLSGANLSYSDVSRANLREATMRGACLRSVRAVESNWSGAIVNGADWSIHADIGDTFKDVTWKGGMKVVKAPWKSISRSDGFSFHLLECEDGLFRVDAGCRWFTMDEAWNHWSDPKHWTASAGDIGSWRRVLQNTIGNLQEETQDILFLFDEMIDRIMKARGKTAPVRNRRAAA